LVRDIKHTPQHKQETRNVYKISVANLKGKDHLEGNREEDNIRMDFKERVWKGAG